MEFNNAPNKEDLLLAQRFIKLLRQSEEGIELLEYLLSDNLRDPRIMDKLRSKVKSYFSTEVKDAGKVDQIINIAAENVNINSKTQNREDKNVTPTNIHLNNPDEFKGLELDVEALHKLFSQTQIVVIYSTECNADKAILAKHYSQLCYEKKIIYPGGICWLDFGKKKLETKLFEFAKSKLDLKLPLIATSKDKVSFIFKNWKEGNVLLVINKINNLNDIEFLSFLNDKRFKLLIVTSKSLVGKLINSVNFELSTLTYFKKDIISQISFGDDLENQKTKNSTKTKIPTFTIIYLCTFLAIISTVSLLGAYVFSNSEPWVSEFNSFGWIIELLRSGFFLYSMTDIVFIIFNFESREFFGIIETPREMIRVIRIMRLLMISFLTFVIVINLYYHLSFAPQELAKLYSTSYPNNQNDYFNLFKLPYIWYLPYSLINYVIIAGSIIATSLYSSSKDVRYLYLCRKKLDIQQQRISNINSINRNYSFLSRESICEIIKHDFEYFSQRFIKKIGRYSSLFLILTIGISFEIIAGKHTLAKTAIVWMSVGYFLFFFALFILLLASRYYEKALTKSAILLLDIGCENRNKFNQDNNIISFVQKIFDTYFSFCLGTILIFASPFIGKLIENFFSN